MYSLSVLSECAGCMVEGYYCNWLASEKGFCYHYEIDNYEEKYKAGRTVKEYKLLFFTST